MLCLETVKEKPLIGALNKDSLSGDNFTNTLCIPSNGGEANAINFLDSKLRIILDSFFPSNQISVENCI